MTVFWIVLALVVGGCAGFVLFACLQMSRDADRDRFQVRASPVDGKTVTRT
jgi:hypothetical protein